MEPTEPQIHARYTIGRSERIAVAVKTSRGSRFNLFVGFVCLILAATTLAMPLVSLGYMVCSAAMLTGLWMVPIALWSVRKEGRISSEIDFAAGFHFTDLALQHLGLDLDAADIDQGEQFAAGVQPLVGRDLQIGDDAVEGRPDD
jgi:hypothetical protein